MADVGGVAATANKGTSKGPGGGKRPAEGPLPPDNNTGDARAPETYQLTTPLASTAQARLQYSQDQWRSAGTYSEVLCDDSGDAEEDGAIKRARVQKERGLHPECVPLSAGHDSPAHLPVDSGKKSPQ